MLSRDLIWHSIPISLRELNLSKVLICGQAFRWKINPAHQNITNSSVKIWSSTLQSHIIFLKQTADSLHYSSYPPFTDVKDLHNLIHDYFQLNISLDALYKTWSEADPNFKTKSQGSFEGVRMLRQDPFETLISFICSSNNNIKRISMMCENLCLNYGSLIGEVDNVKYHSFPTVEQLASQGSALDSQLRQLGFGYRANYIYSTCELIHSSNHDISALRQVSYTEANQSLLQYKGIGPKIADCICLMALDKPATIPVDTHVFQIAKRDYKMKLKGEAVNKGNYGVIAQNFQEKWGEYAGWAQTVMFAADLKALGDGIVKVKKETDVNVEKVITLKRELEVEIKEEINEKDQKLIMEAVKVEDLGTSIEEVEYYNNGRPKRKRRVVIKSEI
ncbi:hypothetical protein WICPIJ_003647 [Wickerhamomyces pijperi]|uniref:DNA-(apurinic or apyrimidinic site) lyase n=1 Tax=Wickerhamomyces pijperi TaxID=599730 RepID=A0A9P8Q982_WICPI|nr:hypothetical protein WICPIJ_003647 [Wickerhamomyces pijperi]